MTDLRADYDRKTHYSKLSGPVLGKTQAEWKREADEAWLVLVEEIKEKNMGDLAVASSEQGTEQEGAEVVRFAKDVAEHRMHILRDDGVYRHLCFRRSDSYCMSFDLVTWPGYLCYCGDMGEFVFSRVPDMFEFFRSPRGEINPQYWAEKCKAAAGRGDGVKEYRPERFHAAIGRWLDDMDADDELRQAVKDEVLPHADDGAYAAHVAARDFEHNGETVFQDFWEADLTEYTHRFIWCCHALVWGIQRYDEARTTTDVSVNPQDSTTLK